jgi:hypothetical protein
VPAKDGGAPRIERKPVFVPDVAVGHPSQNEFGNPYEKMVCFFMHAMHNEAFVKGKDSALVFSNASGSAWLLDLFFYKIKGKIEPERELGDEGEKAKAHWNSFFRKPRARITPNSEKQLINTNLINRKNIINCSARSKNTLQVIQLPDCFSSNMLATSSSGSI